MPPCHALWCPQSLYFLEPTGRTLPFRGLWSAGIIGWVALLNKQKIRREYLQITSQLPPYVGLWNSPSSQFELTSPVPLAGLITSLQGWFWAWGAWGGGHQLPQVWPGSLHTALLLQTHRPHSGWGPQWLSLQNSQAGLTVGT